MNAETIQDAPEEVVAVVVKEGLNEQSGKSLIAEFSPYHAQITLALQTSHTVVDGENPASQKVARTCRLELRRIRCEIENVRKDVKADALRYSKAVDGLANVLKFLCEPEEKRLEEIEKYAERKEAARIAQLVADRTAALVAVDADPSIYNLASMDDATFDAALETARKSKRDRIEAERKAEAERIAREKAEAEAREKMRVENERLKAEAVERERKAEAERKRIEAERAKERAEAEAKAKAEAAAREKERAAERAKAESERLKIEAERAKERAAYEARAKAEADARAKAEAEVKAARDKADADAREKAEAERIALQQAADAGHRKLILNMAYKSLVKIGVEKDVAVAVLQAIADGKVQHVKIVW